MVPKLHRDGRFRRSLGTALGGGEELGDRAFRRIAHTSGAAILVYYVIPTDFFRIAPKLDILLAALAVAVVLEVLRHLTGLELPTIRPYEAHRVASFVFYAVALVFAVALFPVPIGAAIVLGTAFVDPIAGELRSRHAAPLLSVGLPLVAYALLAFVGMAAIGGWPAGDAAALAIVAAPIAVAAEGPKSSWMDDDLLMTVAPGVFLYVVGVLVLKLPA